jgi:hypothetical protein
MLYNNKRLDSFLIRIGKSYWFFFMIYIFNRNTVNNAHKYILIIYHNFEQIKQKIM